MKTSDLFKAAALAALLAGGAATAAPAQSEIIVNGGFEDTDRPQGWDLYDTLPGWSFATNKIELRNGIEGTAASGSNFVELDTYANSQMSQLIHTVAGQTYTLSFQYQDRINVGSSSQGLNVFWGDIPAANSSIGAVVSNLPSVAAWTTKSVSLVGTGADMYLTFAAAGTSDGLGTSLDNVSLTAAVPEPETYAMMLAGLGLIGFAARRKAAKQ